MASKIYMNDRSHCRINPQEATRMLMAARICYNETFLFWIHWLPLKVSVNYFISKQNL